MEITHIIPEGLYRTFQIQATSWGGDEKQSPYVQERPGYVRIVHSFQNKENAQKYYDWGIEKRTEYEKLHGLWER